VSWLSRRTSRPVCPFREVVPVRTVTQLLQDTSAARADDDLYEEVSAALRFKVGRLLNDKMPTGVALSPAMNHGGPYPSTGHPGFTAIGIPASLLRFAALHCYDNVRNARLPAALCDEAPNASMWRFVDGVYKQGAV